MSEVDMNEFNENESNNHENPAENLQEAVEPRSEVEHLDSTAVEPQNSSVDSQPADQQETVSQNNVPEDIGSEEAASQDADVQEPEKPEIKKIKVRSSKDDVLEVVKAETPEESKPVKKTTRRKAKVKEVEYRPKPKEVEQEEYDENYVPGSRKKWYVLKVQVNREDAIKESLKRRYTIAGLDVYFGDILIPTEKITEVRSGKKKIVKKKLYPGYLMIYMEVTEETWFLVRDTPGIGDFTGAVGRPTPMLEHEIQAMLNLDADTAEESPKLRIGFQVGDKVKVKDGAFENYEGEVHQIDAGSGRVTVMINIFGRSAPVELEYWQIESPEK